MLEPLVVADASLSPMLVSPFPSLRFLPPVVIPGTSDHSSTITAVRAPSPHHDLLAKTACITLSHPSSAAFTSTVDLRTIWIVKRRVGVAA